MKFENNSKQHTNTLLLRVWFFSVIFMICTCKEFDSDETITIHNKLRTIVVEGKPSGHTGGVCKVNLISLNKVIYSQCDDYILIKYLITA